MTLPYTHDQVYRDYVVDGNPGSGAYRPKKTEIRALGQYFDLALSFPTATGTANALLVASQGGNVSSYTDGLVISFTAAADNTTAATINVDSVGIANLKVLSASGPTALTEDTLVSGGKYMAIYSTGATAFILINPTVSNIALTSLTLNKIKIDGTDIYNYSTSQEYVKMAGGATVDDGASVVVYGETHATKPNRLALQGTHIAFVDIANAQQGFFDTEAANPYMSLGIDSFVDVASVEYGISLSTLGIAVFSREGSPTMYVKRSDAGDLVRFYQGETFRGSISVNGNTVTYGSFCGTHWSQPESNKRVRNLLPGTVVETVDELCTWKGENSEGEHLPRFKISDTPRSKSVYGVFIGRDDDNDIQIASLGAYLVRIAKNVTVTRGDYLESNGKGCAQVQADDILRASTIGKVTSSTVVTTYPDGSYLVPCTLHCG